MPFNLFKKKTPTNPSADSPETGRTLRIAMLGGTYDPIHYGHIRLGQRYAQVLELDRIYVVPTRTPPHKLATATPGEQRLEMCRLALEDAGDARFCASDIELRRDGLSYSFYTVCSLLELHPGCELYLMVGADNFLTIELWHRFHELKKLVTFCTVCRDGATTNQLREHAAYLEREVGCTCFVTDFDEVHISSTMLREMIGRGEPIDGLTPPPVVDYIHERGLYRA